MMLSYRADERAAMVFQDLASALDAGLPLESLGGNPQLGDHVLVDLCWQRGVKLRPTEKLALEAGWKSGNASLALRKRGAARQRRADFVRITQSALAYPILLCAMLLLASLAVMAVAGTSAVTVILTIYGCGAIFLIVFARMLGRGDSSLERWPVIGGVLREMRELPYLEALHSLYGAGVPIVDAHRTAFPTVHMQGLRKQLGVAMTMLEQGRPLHEALESSASLSPETRQLLATGERAGQLEESLARAIDRRSEMAGRRLKVASRTISGVIYGLVAIGIAIFAIQFYTAYYAPLLKLR
ncbi:MAG: type II secretion system F family protein [Planctomycetota bacterium]|jgi:type II secretory pathway component PulF